MAACTTFLIRNAQCDGIKKEETKQGVIVIGGGVVGVTSAYKLARKGYAVTLLDANEAVSLGTSQVLLIQS